MPRILVWTFSGMLKDAKMDVQTFVQCFEGLFLMSSSITSLAILIVRWWTKQTVCYKLCSTSWKFKPDILALGVGRSVKKNT